MRYSLSSGCSRQLKHFFSKVFVSDGSSTLSVSSVTPSPCGYCSVTIVLMFKSLAAAASFFVFLRIFSPFGCAARRRGWMSMISKTEFSEFRIFEVMFLFSFEV